MENSKLISEIKKFKKLTGLMEDVQRSPFNIAWASLFRDAIKDITFADDVINQFRNKPGLTFDPVTKKITQIDWANISDVDLSNLIKRSANLKSAVENFFTTHQKDPQRYASMSSTSGLKKLSVAIISARGSANSNSSQGFLNKIKAWFPSGRISTMTPEIQEAFKDLKNGGPLQNQIKSKIYGANPDVDKKILDNVYKTGVKEIDARGYIDVNQYGDDVLERLESLIKREVAKDPKKGIGERIWENKKAIAIIVGGLATIGAYNALVDKLNGTTQFQNSPLKKTNAIEVLSVLLGMIFSGAMGGDSQPNTTPVNPNTQQPKPEVIDLNKQKEIEDLRKFILKPKPN